MNPAPVRSRFALPLVLTLSTLVTGCSTPPLRTQEDISPDGVLFATPVQAGVRLTKTVDDAFVRTLSGGHEARVVAVHFTQEGGRLVSGDLDGRIIVWNPRDGKSLGPLGTHRGSIEQFAVRRGIPDLASASTDATIKLWDLEGRKEVRTLTGHAGAVTSVAFSPDGRTLVSTSVDRTVRLWEVETGTELRSLRGHEAGVRAAAFDSTGARLATGGDDGVIKIWDLQAGSELRSMHGANGPILGLFMTQDGRHLLAYQADKDIAIWEIPNGQLVVEDYLFEAKVAPRNWPYRAVFEEISKRAAHQH
jgi:WD40 repeat protein